MEYGLKYGESIIQFNVEHENISVFKHIEPVSNINDRIFYSKLERYFNDKEIKNNKILIIVSDKTRLCGYNIYLPVLTEFLTNRLAGSIEFIIAYGTHKQQTDEESINSYGTIYKQYKFHHHNCGKSKFVSKGISKRGTYIEINELIYKTDILITFGAVSHHYFAGFGGGRKLLFPGLASKKSVYLNHSLFLDKKNNELHKKCFSGNIAGNPLAEDLKEISDILPARYSIHGILNSMGEVCDLYIGDSYEEYTAVCKKYDLYYKYVEEELYENVIASCGGFPKDINLIQAHKGIHNAAAFVKNGGNLLIFAECRDGTGSETFLKYIEMGYEKAFAQLADNYAGNGGTALAMMEKTKRINICMVTGLNDKTCSLINICKVDKTAINKLIRSYNGKTLIIDNAGMIIKG